MVRVDLVVVAVSVDRAEQSLSLAWMRHQDRDRAAAAVELEEQT
jgi:hypothetical protein